MSKELVTIIRENSGDGKPRPPLKRTLAEAEKKFFSNQNQRIRCFVEVEGYEAKDGKLVKKATKKVKED